MQKQKLKRILVAEPADIMPLAFETLGVRDTHVPFVGFSGTGTACLLVPCTSLEAAISALRHPVDLIVCGLHFDESRMFDLLRYAKSNPDVRHIPFLCVKTFANRLDRTVHESITIATRALGAEAFYDLAEERKRLGDELASRRIGAYVYELASRGASGAALGD